MSLSPVVLTLVLASVATFCLMLIGMPLAWWLSQKKSIFRDLIGAAVALPLVLPPTVLGFYLLIAMGPQGFLGKLTEFLQLPSLAFSFSGLVLGSVLYSLPFVVQPLQSSFAVLGPRLFLAARSLGSTPWQSFWRVSFPLARSGLWTGAILGFAHTVGEFGVVLMIGGNIPGKTKVISIAVFDAVEAMDFERAHELAGGLLVFSFLVLWWISFKRQGLRITL